MRFLLVTLVFSLAACQPDPVESPEVDTTIVEAPVEVVSEPEAPFDLNTATAEEFMTIPGVGDRMVHEFEEYRPYASIQEFRREIGKYVDEDQVAAYEEYLFVPINPNAADAETLMQLPGVTAAEAQSLIDARPFASDDAFMEAYESAVADADAATARVYLVRG